MTQQFLFRPVIPVFSIFTLKLHFDFNEINTEFLHYKFSTIVPYKLFMDPKGLH